MESTELDGPCHAEVITARNRRITFTADSWEALSHQLIKALYHCNTHIDRLEIENKKFRTVPMPGLTWVDNPPKRFAEETFSSFSKKLAPKKRK